MPQIDTNLEITVQDVKRMLEAGEAFLFLDVREPQEHALARIEGSQLVPVGDIASSLPRLSAWADQPVVAFCHHGQRSLNVALFLRQQGFEDVRSMAGGIDAWSAHVDPTVPRY